MVRLVVILIVVNLPVYFLIGRLFFGDWAGFREALYFWLTPRWLDWVRNEAFEDTWANLKLFYFLGTCVLLVVSEYRSLVHFFPALTS